MNGSVYPRRLIEVDLPLGEVSAHARREKSLRHGHLSTLHIWWARRPLAACRAALCATLWFDPVDDRCPPQFRADAWRILTRFATQVRSNRELAELCRDHWSRWNALAEPAGEHSRPLPQLRQALLDFIADFANWDAASVPEFLAAARELTTSAQHATNTGSERPVVVDPFCGGGAIPVEALRVGADAIASDMNPVPVLLNTAILDWIPRHGEKLANAYRKAAERVARRAKQALRDCYPAEPNGNEQLAYFWTRTMRCEGPGCGLEIPLIRSTYIKQKGDKWHLRVEKKGRAIVVRLAEGAEAQSTATIKRGAAVCPACGHTTPEKRVKAQLVPRRGGATSARLVAVMVDGPNGRTFREPVERDLKAFEKARKRAQAIPAAELPDEAINTLRPYKNTVGVCIVTRLGISHFTDLYNERQLLCLHALGVEIEREYASLASDDPDLALAVLGLLHLTRDRLVMQNTALSRWHTTGAKIEGLFSKQALQIVWDYAESNPFAGGSAAWGGAAEWVDKVIAANQCLVGRTGTVLFSDATELPLPDHSVDVVFTDPPYFAAVPYGDLADVFYVWLRRGLGRALPSLFRTPLIDKAAELIVTNANKGKSGETKDPAFFTRMMAAALSRARAVATEQALACVVFAESSTQAWESMLGAVLQAGWTVTASWPVDTEMATRTRAQRAASLQSSIFLACRPRPDGDRVGAWRDVLHDMPQRIHDWLPRLAAEGVVGADAIFACIGPALEVYSQYSRVEKSSGDAVSLRDYLEEVWAAVSREALSLLFEGADASGLEEDARLTAMWLWTLRSGTSAENDEKPSEDESEDNDEEQSPQERESSNGSQYVLAYDAARKSAQGLGAHLEKLQGIVETDTDTARLLNVRERASVLFGATKARNKEQQRPKKAQLGLFVEAAKEEHARALGDFDPEVAATTLDRLHQAMLLFGAGRTAALNELLKADGVGGDGRFWRLAQSLSALYPSGSDEKRWVDGVLTRKRSLGF